MNLYFTIASYTKNSIEKILMGGNQGRDVYTKAKI
jgi:hypothetical protein